VTQLKCAAGRTPEEMERILGLRRAELAKVAGVLWLGRLPDREEFALRAYKQCPGEATYDGHAPYAPGLAAVRGAAQSSDRHGQPRTRRTEDCKENPTLPSSSRKNRPSSSTD